VVAVVICGFKAAKGAMPPPNLASNKFQERPSGASRMQENLLAARVKIILILLIINIFV